MPLLAAWMLHLARQRCRSTNSKVDEMDKLAAVNAEVSSLTREAQESMCTADTLSLAHELAHTGNLYKAISKMIKHEHAKPILDRHLGKLGPHPSCAKVPLSVARRGHCSRQRCPAGDVARQQARDGCHHRIGPLNHQAAVPFDNWV